MSVEEKVPVEFFYANSIEVSVSPYDFSVKFMRSGTPTSAAPQQASGVPLDVKNIVQQAMIVALSPSSLKSVLPGLVQAIAIYEKQFGVIPIAPDALAKWNAAVKVQP